MIIDDKLLCIGSANMDSVSLYKSSEMVMNVFNSDICKDTKERLIQEHLGYCTQEMRDNFDVTFEQFCAAGEKNMESLQKSGTLVERVFPLVPYQNYKFIAAMINYPSAIAKIIFKLGVNPQEVVKRTVSHLEKSVDTTNANAFYIQSML